MGTYNNPGTLRYLFSLSLFHVQISQVHFSVSRSQLDELEIAV